MSSDSDLFTSLSKLRKTLGVLVSCLVSVWFPPRYSPSPFLQESKHNTEALWNLADLFLQSILYGCGNSCCMVLTQSHGTQNRINGRRGREILTSHLNYSSHRIDNQNPDKTGIFPLTLVSWFYVLESVSLLEERENLHRTHQAVHSSRSCCEERHGAWEDLHTGISSPSCTVSQSSVLLYAQTGVYPSTSLRWTSSENSPALEKDPFRLFNSFCCKYLLRSVRSSTVAYG